MTASNTTALILNRYRPLETKGSGGFGTVDVVWDNRLQRRVAIKRIPLGDSSTTLPGIQEARTAAMLNEEAHIVSVLDFEVSSTEAMLIMEYVDGPTLNDLLEESQELLDLDTIAAIFTDIAVALEYAHENQVLHLDIKPDNAMIDHKGVVKVADFGLSEISGSLGFSEPQGGTLGYMPPEQIEQEGVDERTDLWALAAILYLLMTGNNPFIAKNSEESLRLILEEPLVLPSEIHEDLNPDADELIIRALMASKYERFGSVQEFSKAIAPYLGSVQKGRKNLKMMVNSRELDEVEFSDEWHEPDPMHPDQSTETAETGLEGLSPWERLPQKLRGFFTRIIAVAACVGFAYLGLSGTGSLLTQMAPLNILGYEFAPPLLILVLVLVGICAFIVPQLGSALASVILVSGLFLRGVWILGAVVAIILVLWWAVLGRKSAALSTLVMLTPLFGFLCLSWSLPLLSGYFLSWRRALLTTAVQAAVLIATAAVTASSNLTRTGLVISDFSASNINTQMLDFIARAEPWIALVAFLIACLIMVLSLERFTYLKAFLGLLAALCLILLSAVLAPLVLDLEILAPDMINVAVELVLSFILLTVLLLLGVPADVEPVEEV